MSLRTKLDGYVGIRSRTPAYYFFSSQLLAILGAYNFFLSRERYVAAAGAARGKSSHRSYEKGQLFHQNFQ
jgi:hypothetical protein